MENIYEKIKNQKKFYSLLKKYDVIKEEVTILSDYEIKILAEMMINPKELKSIVNFMTNFININQLEIRMEIEIDSFMNSVNYRFENENNFVVIGKILYGNQNDLIVNDCTITSNHKMFSSKQFQNILMKNIESDIDDIFKLLLKIHM